MISDGSVGTFCSKITLPASSTTHTDVSFTDTSRPTKCAISSLLPRCSRSPDLDPFIATEGDARSASKAEPQPPRYTILRGKTGSSRSPTELPLSADSGPPQKTTNLAGLDPKGPRSSSPCCAPWVPSRPDRL